jgi:hypothetical protein
MPIRREEARRAGLSPAESAALKQCDRSGLQMAAESFGRKRTQHERPRRAFHRRVLNRLFGR